MDKIKYILYGLFISFVLLGLLSFILAFINTNQEIYIKDIDKYIDSINNLETRIDKLDKNLTCKSSLLTMLKRINNTHFTNGKVKIKEYYDKYYEEDLTFLDYYQGVIEACELDNNDHIYATALTAYAYPNEIKNKYYFSYELHFKDLFNSEPLLKEEQEIKSYTTKYNELLVLSELLEVLE